MHDEDCQLPSLDWLTDSVKCKSSTLHIPDPLTSNFSQHTKRSKIYHGQKNAPKDVDFSKEAIKPPYSYAELITLAMRHHGQSKVLLSDIYEYVRKNFAWYRKTDITWQNSIRHNLSLNKQFIKLPRKKGEKGKGSYWMLDQNAMDSSGLKMKKSGSTNGKMKVLEKGCKPTLNPAILSYLKKQNGPENPGNSYYQLQTVIERDKSPVWWRNEENSTFLNSPDFGQPPLPRFTDAFANSGFENALSLNAESDGHPWQEVDLKITDECLFFDLSM
uniref:Forkhead box protein fkh-2 n=1 Tax=Elaeophora elaphi TaxID=1147741 RepID=A0A0R3S0W4_9BILA